MAVRPTVLLTCGTPGSHKTYVRCAEFLIKWVRFEEGVHYSNFPVNLEELESYMLRKWGIDPEVTRRKIRVFPQDELLSWQIPEQGKRFDADLKVFGPWSWFKSQGITDLVGCHVAIDEAHIFLPKSGQVTTRRRWGDWLAEIRHSGCTVEFITQHLDRLHIDPQNMADERIEVTNLERRYDPYFRIPMAAWYELRAVFIGRYVPCVAEQYQRKQTGKWVVEFDRRYYPNPEKYKLYNSYSASQSAAGPGTGGSGGKHVFEERGQLGTFQWFFANYWFNLGSRTALFFGILFGILYGLPWALKHQREFFVVALKDESKIDQPQAERVAHAAENTEPPRAEVPAVESSAPGPDSANAEPASAEPVSDRVTELEQQLKEREIMVNDQAEALWNLREKNAELRLVAPDHVIWANGSKTSIGEEITDNVFEGRTVESIDFKEREVLLDDGERIRVGRVRPSSPGVGPDERTELGGILRKRTEASSLESARGDQGSAFNDVGGRHADDAVPTVPGAGNGDLDNRADVSGLAGSDLGNPGPDGGISTPGGSASPRRGNIGAGESVLRGPGGTGGSSHSGPPSWAANLRRD